MWTKILYPGLRKGHVEGEKKRNPQENFEGQKKKKSVRGKKKHKREKKQFGDVSRVVLGQFRIKKIKSETVKLIERLTIHRKPEQLSGAPLDAAQYKRLSKNQRKGIRQ